jgi:hypothetical protein
MQMIGKSGECYLCTARRFLAQHKSQSSADMDIRQVYSYTKENSVSDFLEVILILEIFIWRCATEHSSSCL